MKKSQYTEVQMAFALRQADSGAPGADMCAARWAFRK
jgi:hypothetical protein